MFCNSYITINVDIFWFIGDNNFLGLGFTKDRFMMHNLRFRPEWVTLPTCSCAATGSGNSNHTHLIDQFEIECFLGSLQ